MRPPQIIHVVSRREITDAETLGRCQRAWPSWSYFYESGAMVARHCWKTTRNATSIGDKRDLPFLLDVLKYGMAAVTDKNDIIFFTNDDVMLHPMIAGEIRRHIAMFDCGSIRRVDIDTRKNKNAMPPLYSNPTAFIEASWPHLGRDGFVFTRGWLERYMSYIPDFILGSWGWDICVAILMRLVRGVEVVKMQSLYDTVMGAELPDGLLIHEAHDSKWQEGDWPKKPANDHNRRLFEIWQKQYAPSLTAEKVDQQQFDKATIIRYTRFWGWKKWTFETMCQGLRHEF